MVWVLYEDSLVPGGKPSNYGPHVLLAQCVAERVGALVGRPFGYSGRRLIQGGLQANPRKGNATLRDEVFRGLSRLTRGARRVVAVYDRDVIHELVGVADPTCTPAIVGALTPPQADPATLATVLLDANLESLLEALRACGMSPTLPWSDATRKARGALQARDRIMHNAAEPQRRALRDCLMQSMPSFEYLVCKVASAVMAAPWFGRL